ncbi:stevor [Plasmodium falciparum NF54]|uniref:Stevor n=2 Tax=Plasmodium falciparum TaxID=5833 RepID=A0A143ZW11_PLAF7|nr:stevor [Plasmodium falciparum 3D7]EWC88884.1 hypothetical protein PFNF54_02398 [Plasmodium falciparum NF54]KAF4330224.1 stevor [Plasmodium falciparum NF54]PKC46197.1 stevor [Plasmodium falciparum NF54]CZT62769.1 stevor [Plasmodium falciparum 3D7]|eukprot:XP_002808736.1 stevor [Plasmodium falciparum 3D7]
MISYNFKLFIFSIILGTLSLIYNNDYERLYKNKKYKNILYVPTNFRSLAEVSLERRTNHIQQNYEFREHGNTNETKYKKNKYPKDDAKTKQKILKVTEKENTGTPNYRKYKKGTYDKEKEEKSNRSPHSLKYLELQRKLYNNFYVKSEMDFHNLSDKSNDNFYECAYENKLYDTLYLSNKVHDNYLDNLKSGCAGGIGVCALSFTVTKIAGSTAAANALITNVYTSVALNQLSQTLVGLNLFFESVIQTAITSGKISIINSSMATKAATDVSGAFGPYGIAIYVIIAIIVVLIILYIWLRKTRKNSWKHECKKYLCK